MLLSRSQRIILGAAVGVALLLLVGLIAFACAKPRTAENAPSPSPSASATATPSPSPTPTPSARPTETPVYRLPLVPFAEETDAPTASPLAPVTAKPIDPSAMIEGRFDSNVRDFLTVGTEDGEPVAVLLVRLAPPNLWVLSVPCETLPTEPQTDAVTPAPSPKNEKNAAARRVSRAVASELGLKLDHTLTLDLTCAEEVVEFLEIIRKDVCIYRFFHASYPEACDLYFAIWIDQVRFFILACRIQYVFALIFRYIKLRFYSA